MPLQEACRPAMNITSPMISGCRPAAMQRDALAGRSDKCKPVPAGDEESRPSADAPSGLLLEPVSSQPLTFGPEDQTRPLTGKAGGGLEQSSGEGNDFWSQLDFIVGTWYQYDTSSDTVMGGSSHHSRHCVMYLPSAC
jgi:hypothetical protein